MKKDERLSMRVSVPLYNDLKALAAADKRSLASYVDIVLQAHVDSIAARLKPARPHPKP